jgi:hemerythrin-like domain-containing protein
MQATDYLKTEHEVIERVLNMLEQTVQQIRNEEPVPEGFGLWAITFFREFADQCHHEKEEELLFPLLEERGVPREGGPIGVMLNEHEIGRDCVRRMQQAVGQSPLDEESFTAAAVEYIELLRQHITKENQVLFQMADHCLSTQDDVKLIEAFAGTACQRHGREQHYRFLAEVEGWEACFQESVEDAGVETAGSQPSH